MPRSYATPGSRAPALTISEEAPTTGVGREWEEGDTEDMEARVVGPRVYREWSGDRGAPSDASNPK